MDGRGRCHDNIFVERLWWTVKHERVYLRPATNGIEQKRSLGKGETSSRLPGSFSLFLPGSRPNNRNRCTSSSRLRLSGMWGPSQLPQQTCGRTRSRRIPASALLSAAI
jgi:hypothetical protein